MRDDSNRDTDQVARGIAELMLANLFAVFNERDPERRLEAIARNYTEDVVAAF